MTDGYLERLIEETKYYNRTSLDLSRQGLTVLPESIGQLTNLKELNLSHNGLISLPQSIGQLSDLTTLDLYGNRLTSLPESIGMLFGLTHLQISSNQLTILPESIGRLSNLLGLYIYDNQLASIPESFWQLSNLAELDLSANELTFIPESIGRLSNLDLLYLYFNQLTSLPGSIGRLVSLNTLDLSSNELTSLPESIGLLTGLTELDLSANELTSLPGSIGRLLNLTKLSFKNNPIAEAIPPSIIGQGVRATIAHLVELTKNQRKRYEAKLLLLGDGNEGKTCVSRAIRGLPFKKQVTTRGVDVQPWTFEHPEHPEDEEKKITLNLWDFEGQEIHHQTHQFFLTKDSLYILVFKCRDHFKMDRAEYWLDTIRSRAPESKVFIVITECEQRTPTINWNALKANYGDMLFGDRWYFLAGCSNDKDQGIADLKVAIQQETAGMGNIMGIPWPVSYSEVEEKIRELAEEEKGNKPYLKKSELLNIFRIQKIEENNFGNLATILGNTGVITHFPDCPELSDFIVIRPQWLTKAISLVLEDKKTADNGGKISHRYLRSIWDAKYPNLFREFHTCMEEFELCYDMDDRRHCLIPLRFDSIKPDTPWSINKGHKERRVEYKLNIRPPKGIMSRFIVKTHHWIAKTEGRPQGVYWLNGVFLQKGQGDNISESLCEFKEDERTLTITVRAAFPQGMIEQLHGIVTAVFDFYDGLHANRSYGCLIVDDNTGSEEQCNKNHLEQDITFAVTQNIDLQCSEGLHLVNPKTILTGFTSFGTMLTVEKLRKELNKQPEWARNMVENISFILKNVTSIAVEVEGLLKQGEEIPARVRQEIELLYNNHLRDFSVMLDDRDFNSAPAVVSILPVEQSKWKPSAWFNTEYILTPYCECGQDMHPIEDASVNFKMPQRWWETTAPSLDLGFKILFTGIRIASAGLPLAVGKEMYEHVKYQAKFMEELGKHFTWDVVPITKVDKSNFEMVRRMERTGKSKDFIHKQGREDLHRKARIQLSRLLSEIAPENYRSRQWGSLRRVRMSDDTYRWLCREHEEKMG